MSTTTLPAADRIASPYKGLDHYEEQDAPFFFGRRDASDLVVANLIAARLTLLYGESGVGKSSLVHAGVIPQLREAPHLAVVSFRSWSGDPVADLAAAIRKAALIEPPARERSLVAVRSCGRSRSTGTWPRRGGPWRSSLNSLKRCSTSSGSATSSSAMPEPV
jgi:hypothetical protein